MSNLDLTDQTASKIATLDYAKAPSRKRRAVRRAMLVLLIATICYSTYRWGPQAWRQVRTLYWQRQCLRYTAPADMVVYEEEPSAMAALLAKDSRYVKSVVPAMPSPIITSPNTAWVSFTPDCWGQFMGISAINPYSPIGPNCFSGQLFLHELTSPGGHRRLVSMTYASTPNSFSPQLIHGFNYQTFVIKPASATTPAKLAPSLWLYDLTTGILKTPPNVRFYAGQLDPADPSHFTVRYEMWGQTDILDGWLGDDGLIRIQQRKIPQQPRLSAN